MSIDVRKIAGIVLSGGIGAVVAVVALAGANEVISRRTPPHKIEVVHPIAVGKVDGTQRILRVGRSSDLSFHVTARIKGQSVRMLVDSGANISVLTAADAARIGMPNTGMQDYTDVVGITSSIRRYRNVGRHVMGLGPIAVHDVPLSVDDSGELQNSILGQDAFCNIDKITIENNAITFLHNTPVAPGC